ncbi:MAG: nuclear transport factor 2 family protein [Caulobacterales bacterium]
MSQVEIAQAQLDAYNAQDLDKYMTYFTEDCVIADLNGVITSDGAAAIRVRYEKAFAQFPQNKAILVNRIAVGNTVVDHEDVVRAPGGERFEIIAIYTFRGEKISRVDFAR